jgi:protein-tyrosine phosphatase
MFTILFVCTGNTCRSSMAQCLAKGLINEKGISKNVRVLSAGTSIIPNSRAPEQAIQVMEKKGLDLKNHVAKQLTPEMIEEADLILTMTRSNKQFVLSMVPKAQDKVFTLKEYVQNLISHNADVEKQLLDLSSRLENKEQDFYNKNKETLLALKEEKRNLMGKLHEVERKIQDWHLKFREATKIEREALKRVEEQLLDIDVVDPIGQPVEKYQECADEIEDSLHIILKNIIKDLKK